MKRFLFVPEKIGFSFDRIDPHFIDCRLRTQISVSVVCVDERVRIIDIVAEIKTDDDCLRRKFEGLISQRPILNWSVTADPHVID